MCSLFQCIKVIGSSVFGLCLGASSSDISPVERRISKLLKQQDTLAWRVCGSGDDLFGNRDSERRLLRKRVCEFYGTFEQVALRSHFTDEAPTVGLLRCHPY